MGRFAKQWRYRMPPSSSPFQQATWLPGPEARAECGNSAGLGLCGRPSARAMP